MSRASPAVQADSVFRMRRRLSMMDDLFDTLIVCIEFDRGSPEMVPDFVTILTQYCNPNTAE